MKSLAWGNSSTTIAAELSREALSITSTSLRMPVSSLYRAVKHSRSRSLVLNETTITLTVGASSPMPTVESSIMDIFRIIQLADVRSFLSQSYLYHGQIGGRPHSSSTRQHLSSTHLKHSRTPSEICRQRKFM